MTFDEAMSIAKNNPGQGVRDNPHMGKGWKIVWISWPKKGKNPAGGDYFCITTSLPTKIHLIEEYQAFIDVRDSQSDTTQHTA